VDEDEAIRHAARKLGQDEEAFSAMMHEFLEAAGQWGGRRATAAGGDGGPAGPGPAVREVRADDDADSGALVGVLRSSVKTWR